jgi:hypothetical protein
MDTIRTVIKLFDAALVEERLLVIVERSMLAASLLAPDDLIDKTDACTALIKEKLLGIVSKAKTAHCPDLPSRQN